MSSPNRKNNFIRFLGSDFKKGEIVSSTLRRLSDWIADREMPLEMLANENQILHLN